MKALLVTGGALNFGLAILHMMFWKTFNWKETLKPLNNLQQAVMQVLNIHLILALLLFAYLSIFSRSEMVNTSIGRTITLFIASFYAIRTVNQFIFFDMSKGVSWFVVTLCIVLTVIYGLIWKSSIA